MDPGRPQRGIFRRSFRPDPPIASMSEAFPQNLRSEEFFGRRELAARAALRVDRLGGRANRWGTAPVSRTSDCTNQGIQHVPAEVPYDCDDLVDQHTMFNKILCGRNVALRAIRNAHRTSLRALFCVSPPPQLDSLVGEYDAELLDQGSWVSNVTMKSLFRTQGAWLGKAFHPVGQTTGVGYNVFRSRGSVVRKLPMDTQITESALDPGLCLRISYRGKNEGIVEGLTGEVRQVTTNVMIGIGVFGPRIGGRDLWRRKIPFLLVGPRRTFQHAAVNQSRGKLLA